MSSMDHLLKIGITGCIGSGKSTVSKIFAQLGVPVYDADSRAKELMVTSSEIIEGIKKLFGEESYHSDGTLNRKQISSIAFQNKNLLKKLNGLVHPAVLTDFDQWCKQQNSAYIIKEAALMFESDSHTQVDKIIVITAPENLRISRTMQRDQIAEVEVLNRMKNQWSEDDKLRRADFEIKNNEVELLIPQVLKLHGEFVK